METNKKFSGAAKYDYIKVKIWIKEHYYIFSRFLLSRMLTLANVKKKDSTKICLELKQTLVDGNYFEITQVTFKNLKQSLNLKKNYFRFFKSTGMDLNLSTISK
jgi:2-phosphoglycerate kinase